MINKTTVILLIGGITNSAHAAYTCTGKIDAINQGHDGSVSITSTAMYGNSQGRKICDLSIEWNGVSPDTCKGWLSKLLSHEARSEEITLQYNDANTACSDQPAWSSASKPWALW